MVVVIFDTASPALGTDVFAADSNMAKLIRGPKARKILWISIMGGTVGTGKFRLSYGSDIIAEHLQSQTATNAWLSYVDYQAITDNRWCSPETNLSLVVTEAPAATLKILVGLLESGAGKR